MSKPKDTIQLSNQIGHLIDEYVSVNKMSYAQIVQILEILKLDYYTEMLEMAQQSCMCDRCEHDPEDDDAD